MDVLRDSLAGDRVERSGRLDDALGNGGHDEVHEDGQKRRHGRRERVLQTRVLRALDDARDGPSRDVHPAHGGRKGESLDDGVERLALETTGDVAADALEFLEVKAHRLFSDLLVLRYVGVGHRCCLYCTCRN
ncbi:MAG: hypothetical protein CMK23_07130 [Porticoccaceae bacterium]|nr:hypothetical protein [Porticoccaceae bacterium]